MRPWQAKTFKCAATSLVFLLVIGVGLWMTVTQPLIGEVSPTEPITVDPFRLRTHVTALAEEFRPRDWLHPKNLDQAAGYIRSEFESAGLTVADQTYEMEGRTYRNVIASIGPDTKGRVVVGAHYDAFGELPGADDNASGVAGLIELAHRLPGINSSVRIDLVAFTLEEPMTPEGDGLFRSEFGGSSVYIRSLEEQGRGVRVFLNLEMIGYFSDENGSQQFPLGLIGMFYPSMGNFITIVGRVGQGKIVRRVKGAMRSATALPVHSMSAHEIVEGVDWSDHSNFWNAGYDAVMITDTSFLRNTAYHTEGDTADRLDYERMAMVVEGVYAAVREFAR